MIVFVLALSLGPVSSALAQNQSLEDRIRILEETAKKQEETIKEQMQLIKELKTEVEKKKPAVKQAGAPTKQATPAVAEKPGETTIPGTAPEAQLPQATEAKAAPATVTPSPQTVVLQEQVKDLKDEMGQLAEAQKQEFLSKFNPSIGFVGETLFSFRSQPAKYTYFPFPQADIRPGGFDVFQRSMELNIAGSVDPFARAYAVLNASADPVTGEAAIGVEEAAILTTSLPWNLTIKGGRFFGEFGRLSYIHDHELPFVFRPLVLDSYIGGESQTDGVQFNWLLPFKHYVSLTAGVGDKFGNPPNDVGDYRRWTGLNFWGRLSTYFDLTQNISFEPGASWLFNPNAIDRGGVFFSPEGDSIAERQRRVAGVDVTFRYQPLRNNQFKSLTWGTEVLFSDNRYDVTQPDGTVLPSRNVGSYGLYSYLAYRFHREWTAGFEFQWLQSPQDKHTSAYAYSPYITWNLSHWNMLRLEYTYTQPYGKVFFPGFNDVSPAVVSPRDNNMVTLQWAWIIGSHAHGWQER
jgi:uncharacterized coiled-coil protein SlyX